ncbi:deoxyuridine 5'-triphosphate nucleotidohydrolase [Listeria fleischmannii subsp. fleischmannii]|uniref:Deoxyuridine 5'-triphosphate nucleotidohydrolase n=2 Tax=Listeria fleischmannii TaxID=1069827 RepID=A0A2X3GUU7_9LIST|nr:deoxyuridine 5'-triphosphate nucleotidohydrolase [Listeria fleischmannii subsp. fleischmannii]
MRNISDTSVKIECGERIAQGIFTKYLVADVDDVTNEQRAGGVGSTGK